MLMAEVDKEVAFTNAWWERTVRSELKLINWLRKLQQTEEKGYYDYQSWLDRFPMDERTAKIINNICLDELQHSNLIVKLIYDRGFVLLPVEQKSTYWEEMEAHIVDLPTACAVNYFGEALAAFRFEVIYTHPSTPPDIKTLLDTVLPDEQFHRETLKRLAGDELIEKFQSIHNQAVLNLKAS